MKAFASLVLAAALASCSAFDNDHPTVQDGGAGSDVMPDAAQGATFTSFVIDQVLHHTADPTAVDYSTFKDLPDPDSNNAHAYDSLFQ